MDDGLFKPFSCGWRERAGLSGLAAWLLPWISLVRFGQELAMFWENEMD
jgi:hypothetical protein